MGNHRQQPPAGAAHPPPPSPTAKATSKYTNKDGSKIITLPKASSSTTDSAQPSPSLDPPSSKTTTHFSQGGPGSPPPTQPVTVNRKKQKRREKEAQKKALAEVALPKENPPSPTDSAAPSHDRRSLDVEHDFSEGELEQDQHSAQGQGAGEGSKSKKSKKKKKQAAGGDDTQSHHDYHDHQDHHDHIHHHAPPAHRSSNNSKERIWDTSNQEERRRIKEYWLALHEDERKSLVKIEKDAVLRKMKEQQKHTCSCTVCGRKRTAIEEELEGLYDAYYQELEQYAHQPNQNGEGPPMMGSPKHLGPAETRAGSSRGPPSNSQHSPVHGRPSHGRIVEHVSDDEDDEEGEEYDSGEELFDDDHYDENAPVERNSYQNEFFNFGRNLTVTQGGILTVADDLLKNDGRKFIEMMEQLAERRMAREEEAKAQYRSYNHTNGGGYGHSHPPPEEEDYDDEDDEDEYDDDEDEEYDSEQEDNAMTDEQRMEEGRRMFQIFAARMFEQRVKTAYREKVAKERQQKLIEEVDEERKLAEQRKLKKAKEAQKRKDKVAKKKEQLAEEKRRKEAEKAAEDAKRKEEEEKKAAEQKAKAEEKRKKKEALKQAEDAARLKKEAERQQRIHEQKELERRKSEAKERERKAKEDAAKQKEREAKERKEQQEREKAEREAAKSRALREATEKAAEEPQKPQKPPKQPAPVAPYKPATAPPTATPVAVVKRPPQHAIPTPVPALPQQPAASVAAAPSPQITVATPALSKVQLTMRTRQPSQQESTSGNSQSTAPSESNPSQAPSPHALTPSHSSPGPTGLNSKPGLQQMLSHGTSPMNIPLKTSMAPQHYGGYAVSSAPMPQPGPSQLPPPGLQSPMSQYPAFPASSSPFSSFGNMHTAGLPGGPTRSTVGRPFAYPPPPPGFNGASDLQFAAASQAFQSGAARDNGPVHQRQPSLGGYEHQSPSVTNAQPFSRQMPPIGRPPSVTPGQRPAASLPSLGFAANDTQNGGLGSSALLDDSEEAPEMPAVRRNTSIPGLPHTHGLFHMEGFGSNGFNSNGWGAAGQQAFYGGSSPPGLQSQGMSPHWASQPSSGLFGSQPGMARPAMGRSSTLRQLLCRACTALAESPSAERLDGGFVSLNALERVVNDGLRQMGSQEATGPGELRALSETLGNSINGGGIFETQDQSGTSFVRWIPDQTAPRSQLPQQAIGARGAGQIGSPAISSSYTAVPGGN